MNTKGALKKAVELFGQKAIIRRKKCCLYDPNKNGHIRCSGIGTHQTPCPGGLWECCVGRLELGMFFAVKGSGYTWEEAFAQYEYRNHADYCRRCVKDKRCRKGSSLKKAMDAFKATTWRSIVEVA